VIPSHKNIKKRKIVDSTAAITSNISSSTTIGSNYSGTARLSGLPLTEVQQLFIKKHEEVPTVPLGASLTFDQKVEKLKELLCSCIKNSLVKKNCFKYLTTLHPLFVNHHFFHAHHTQCHYYMPY